MKSNFVVEALFTNSYKTKIINIYCHWFHHISVYVVSLKIICLPTYLTYVRHGSVYIELIQSNQRIEITQYRKLPY